MELLFWLLLGAAIGIHAAQKRGFSMAGGVIGGLLLGPLAFLMYLVSKDNKKCPYCGEWVKGEARICKHCHKELAA